VAAALEHLSHLDHAVGQAYNIADDSHPTLEEALTLASETFGQKAPKLHLPLPVVKAAAKLEGMIASLRGKIPDLEYDAVHYLYDDYIVDNSKLKETGFTFLYPDFKESMKQIGEYYGKEGS
jgi:UDP-glucose 4-epimerase